MGKRYLRSDIVVQARLQAEARRVAAVFFQAAVQQIHGGAGLLHLAVTRHPAIAQASRAAQYLLGVPAELINDDRLYRLLDHLVWHKSDLEHHLRQRLGELFALEYDLLLYDVTSTYFEGVAPRNKMARRGHSRDQRGDCLQVCTALVVTREGMQLGYEVFDGNTTDDTTVKTIVGTIEARYGLAQRIWVMDRGMRSKSNVQWLQDTRRRLLQAA